MGVTEGDPKRRSGSNGELTAAAVGIGLTVAGVVGSGIGAFLVAFVSVLAVGDPTGLLWFVVVTTAIAELGYLAVGCGYVRLRDRDVSLSGPSRGDARDALAGAVGALVVGVGLFSLLAVVDLQPQAFFVEQEIDSATFLGTAAVFVLVAPPAEEYLFRGAIQGRLRETFGSTGAITGAALLFGAVHFFNYLGSSLPAMLAGALVLTLVGGIFGYVYERTDNLLVPIAAHTGYNLVLMAASATAFL